MPGVATAAVPFREFFFKLRGLIKDGKWCRDTVDDGRGNYCMLGMVGVVVADDPHRRRDRGSVLVTLLDQAIPKEELEELRRRSAEGVWKINGGTIRGFGSPDQRVATYNNTRKDETEIEEWVDRALALSMS